jgi:tetratricopeptide (TPR) repeat protein
MAGMRWFCLGIVVLWGAGLACAQASPQQDRPAKSSTGSQSPSVGELPPSEAPPRSDSTGQSPAAADDRSFSSSRENIIDLSPPKDDLKEHPDSAAAMAKADEEENASADVQEFHPWNPMKALKDVEIGDYYFKRKNYRAALDRYKEALFYKENDAEATFRLAVCQEKMSDKAGALEHYAAYLKILPHGPFADEARDSIARLGGPVPAQNETAAQQTAPAKP